MFYTKAGKERRKERREVDYTMMDVRTGGWKERTEVQNRERLNNKGRRLGSYTKKMAH